MNKAERSFLYLALFLFALGWGSRLGALDRLTPFASVDLPLADESAGASHASSLQASVGMDSIKMSVPPRRASKASVKKKLAAPVPINRATAQELCAIKGIGPALAAKIIEYRTRKGPFRGPRDLDKVPGIGEKKLKSMCEWVIFD
jgi:competence ComEA-like helix-hairpin-helix protein